MNATTESIARSTARRILVEGYEPTVANIARLTTQFPVVMNMSDRTFARFAKMVQREVEQQS